MPARPLVWIALILTVLAIVFFIVGGPWLFCGIGALIAAILALVFGEGPRPRV